MNARDFKTIEISRRDNIFIRFLYNTAPGRVALRLFTTRTVSKIFGLFMSSRISKLLIRRFVKRNRIDMSEYVDKKYASFNDFFTRKVKAGHRAFSKVLSDLPAPCDGKLTAYRIAANSAFQIKGSVYTLNSLLQDRALAGEFADGVCLIFRLTPDDYHRYAFIDDGEIISRKRIKGILHTVRPIALRRYNVYAQNTREYMVMSTKRFGKIVQMEVGALFVGRISNHPLKDTFKRGDEKGMFEFGGSTIVMLFKRDAVLIDDAIYENTRRNRETVVKMGYRIGEKSLRPKRWFK
ncbi:MAG: phosphatidylserine decarboxylase [Chitinispirillales bacterium]|jgi:phosphatidylserine decarboxylase|nr:phosphatidylserine decarboxylase [Chitinispirillales bacterium]